MNRPELFLYALALLSQIALSCSEDERIGGYEADMDRRPDSGRADEMYYVDVEQSLYEVSSEGGSLEICFSTNIPEDELSVFASGAMWLVQGISSKSSSSADYVLALEAMPNHTDRDRSAQVFFARERFGKRETMATVTVSQSGTGSDTPDYSADGTVRILQEAVQGEGIPVVLIGDGFTDDDVDDGTYDSVMDEALENLFSEPPVSGLKEYFDVYAVTAVSRDNRFDGRSTAIGCVLEGGTSTGISGNDEAVMEYVGCVGDVQVEDVLAVVVLNTEAYAGTTYFGYSLDGEMTEFAIAYCPVIYGRGSEQFRQVLVHEAIGHGFAKLEDEYSYEGTIPAAEKSQVQYLQSLGWAQNVDFTEDETDVLWSRFLADNDNYASEGLGIFEGACTYSHGVYRPSEDSMMNSNTTGFNAPSRKSIYDAVMERGAGRIPEYDEFVEFDKSTAGVQVAVSRNVSGPAVSGKRFSGPRFTEKSLDGFFPRRAE